MRQVKDRNIHINTGLPGFRPLDAITEAGAEGISGLCRLADAPFYLGMESLAQLGAFHVRMLTDFEKHVVLATINRCPIPQKDALTGTYHVTGRLVSRSSAAFAYDLAAGIEGKVEITGNFLYAVFDYDERWQREKLRNYYLRLFRCLQNGTAKSSSGGEVQGCSGPRLS